MSVKNRNMQNNKLSSKPKLWQYNIIYGVRKEVKTKFFIISLARLPHFLIIGIYNFTWLD